MRADFISQSRAVLTDKSCVIDIHPAGIGSGISTPISQGARFFEETARCAQVTTAVRAPSRNQNKDYERPEIKGASRFKFRTHYNTSLRQPLRIIFPSIKAWLTLLTFPIHVSKMPLGTQVQIYFSTSVWT